METNPYITIVVPVRNRQEIVTRTLDSIAVQTYRPLRLVIVDNDSSDGTLGVITKWKHANESESFKIDILSEPTQGASAARNTGLAAVDSEYVMFFDSDDEMLPHHTQRIATELTRFPETDIMYWDIAYIDYDGWMNVKRQEDSDLLRCHLLHGTLSTQRYIARTSLVRQTGGWNNNLSIWLDLEIGTRLLLTEPRTRKLHGEPSVLIHPTDDSITGTSYCERAEGMERTLATIYRLLDDDHSYYRNIINTRRAITAAHYRREGDKQRAQRLMETTTREADLRNRLALHTIYHTIRLAGHGGAMLAPILYPKKKKK